MKAVKQEGNIEEGQIAAGYSKLFPKLFPQLYIAHRPLPDGPGEVKDLGAQLCSLPTCLLSLH